MYFALSLSMCERNKYALTPDFVVWFVLLNLMCFCVALCRSLYCLSFIYGTLSPVCHFKLF